MSKTSGGADLLRLHPARPRLLKNDRLFQPCYQVESGSTQARYGSPPSTVFYGEYGSLSYQAQPAPPEAAVPFNSRQQQE